MGLSSKCSMPSGLSNKVIGQSGEFAVCAQLGKLGFVATPFSGNVPHYDVIVTNERLDTVALQVKATFGNSSWIVGDARYWMEIDFEESSGIQSIVGPSDIGHPNLIMVYVWLSRKPGEADRFFLLPKGEVQKILVNSYRSWLAKHNGKRPRKPGSFHIIIDLSELIPYENAWELIRNQLKDREAQERI
jgi:hypothetical protein